ncbi:hypothetical protein TNCV_3563071 [Trichonephila clavipes]|nr:hypothetical protein TNCV_3563071 [Trichonephila clavipes]
MTPPKRGKFPKNIPYHDVFMGTLPSSRRGKCVTLFGGMNPISAFRIKIVASVLGGIVVNAHCSVHLSLSNWPVTWRDSLQNPTFQQDYARLHVAGIVSTLLDAANVWLLSLHARSPDLSPKENVWSMIAERLTHHHMLVTTVDALWHRIEAAWTSVPLHVIQSMF